MTTKADDVAEVIFEQFSHFIACMTEVHTVFGPTAKGRSVFL